MNEQNMPQEQNPANIWVIVAAVVITALVVGGVVYALQSSRLKSSEQSFQQQITLLQNQIDQLQQTQQNQNQQATQPTTPAPTVKSAQPTPTDEATDWNTYTNSQYGYSINYPKTNAITSLDKDNDRIYVSNVKIGDDILIRVLSKASLATSPVNCAAEKTLIEQVKCVYLVLENNANKIIQQKFGENNFVYADFEAVNHPNVKTRNIWAFASSNDYIYEFEILNPNSTNLALFKQIISTLKISN